MNKDWSLEESNPERLGLKLILLTTHGTSKANELSRLADSKIPFQSFNRGKWNFNPVAINNLRIT